MQKFDILFENITVVPMDDAGSVFDGAFVGVSGGKITYFGTQKPEGASARVINGAGKVLMPGFINAHTHIPMTLLRGFADDLNLQDWLFNYIFPAEAKLTDDMVYYGAQLAVMECLASGTVGVTDMYDHAMALARALDEGGMKANISRPLMCFEPDYDPKTDIRLKELAELADAYHGRDGGRILVDCAIHGEYTSHAAVWETAAGFAAERGLGIHVHISETKTEHDECVARHGLTPAAVLERHGVFLSRVTAAHCVHVTDEDMEIMARHGATAVHNPVSNLKLDSGVARVGLMLEKGVNVALGTDGVSSNNSHDMLEEIKTAAMLHHGAHPLRAYGALMAATVSGALSQGRTNETGRVAEGYDADLIMLDFDAPHLTPRHNVLSLLAYSARGSDVCMTMVRGRVLYEKGEFLTVDRERVLSEARKIARIF